MAKIRNRFLGWSTTTDIINDFPLIFQTKLVKHLKFKQKRKTTKPPLTVTAGVNVAQGLKDSLSDKLHTILISPSETVFKNPSICNMKMKKYTLNEHRLFPVRSSARKFNDSLMLRQESNPGIPVGSSITCLNCDSDNRWHFDIICAFGTGKVLLQVLLELDFAK